MVRAWAAPRWGAARPPVCPCASAAGLRRWGAGPGRKRPSARRTGGDKRGEPGSQLGHDETHTGPHRADTGHEWVRLRTSTHRALIVPVAGLVGDVPGSAAQRPHPAVPRVPNAAPATLPQTRVTPNSAADPRSRLMGWVVQSDGQSAGVPTGTSSPPGSRPPIPATRARQSQRRCPPVAGFRQSHRGVDQGWLSADPGQGKGGSGAVHESERTQV